MVLLEAERDVVEGVGVEAFESRTLSEGDGASGIAAVAPDAEAKMLTVADGCELGQPAAGS